MGRIRQHNDGYWLEFHNSDDNAKGHWEKCREQMRQSNSGTLGKYLIFCDDMKLLTELAEFILIKFDISHAKISTKVKATNKGFGHVLCVYDYEPRYKKEVYDAIYEFHPATYDHAHQVEEYPINYRYWKADAKTLEENGLTKSSYIPKISSSPKSAEETFSDVEVKPRSQGYSKSAIPSAPKMRKNQKQATVIHIPAVVFKNGRLMDGIDAFKEDFTHSMNEHMMDKHPEIFNAEWEENEIDYLSDPENF